MPVSASQLPNRTLRLEARGTSVHTVERALAQLGYLANNKYSRDGYFGTKTRVALAKYQRANKLKATGVFDAATRRALGKSLRAKSARVDKALPDGTLRLEARGAKVRNLEGALAKTGFMANDALAKDSYFGTSTRDALVKLQTKFQLKKTGVYDQATRARLAKLLIAKPSKPAQPKGATVGAPPANYSHVNFRGAEINVRTRAMILRAELYLKAAGVPWKFSITQGSFNHSVSASGGTHDGAGAIDLSVRGPSGAYRPYAQVAKAVKALRKAGFAAWSRGFNDGTSFTKHIHGIAIGDKQMSSAARAQVAQYFAGRNGLVNHGLDRDRGVGRPYPEWAKKFR